MNCSDDVFSAVKLYEQFFTFKELYRPLLQVKDTGEERPCEL